MKKIVAVLWVVNARRMRMRDCCNEMKLLIMNEIDESLSGPAIDLELWC